MKMLATTRLLIVIVALSLLFTTGPLAETATAGDDPRCLNPGGLGDCHDFCTCYAQCFDCCLKMGPSPLDCLLFCRQKFPPPSVGGIAELPDVSDSSGRNYIALGGLAAAALVALTAGGWYARRRLLR